MSELLNRGKVSFAFYDAKRERREYAGETRFDIQYRYRNLSRWQVMKEDGRRKLVIRSRFRQVELTWTHTISLPVAMASERLYEQPLVLHELDHVRVSTHPALAELFQKWLETEAEVITVQLAADQTPDSQWIQAQVKEATKPLFQRLMDLVRVRYQELDRVTSHGLYAVPDDFFPAPVPAPTTPAPTTPAPTR